MKTRVRHAAPHRDRRSEGEVEDEDLIQREDMVVTVSHLGYVKRVPLSTYRAQRRGGKGRAGMQTRDEDFVVAAVRRLDAYAGAVLLLARPGLQGKGLAAAAGGAAGARQGADQHPAARAGRDASPSIMPLPEDEKTWGKLDVMFATTKGTVRRNKLSDFVDVRRSGIIAMKLDEGEAHRRRADLHREGRRAADRRGRPVHPLPGAPTCACSRAAPRWACAASRSTTTTR